MAEDGRQRDRAPSAARGATGAGVRRRARQAEALRRDLLALIATGEAFSQRTLARALGVALGLVNAEIARCAADGLIEASGGRGRRYSYALTEAGRAALARIEARTGAGSAAWFARAAASFDRLYAALAAAGKRRIVLGGIDPLTEVALLCSLGTPLRPIGIWRHAGRPLALRGVPGILLDNLGNADAVVVAVQNRPSQVYAALRRRLPAERIAVPDVIAPLIDSDREG